MSNSINATPELLGAIGSAIGESEIKARTADVPADIIIVKNSDNEIHLPLPFYTDAVSKAAVATDEELEEVAGAMFRLHAPNNSVVNYVSVGEAGLKYGSAENTQLLADQKAADEATAQAQQNHGGK